MIARAAVSSGLQPFQLAILGNAGAGPALLAVARATAPTISWERRHMLLSLVSGVVGFAVPNVVTYVIVDRVGPAYMSSLHALSPVLTMALAALVGLEGLTHRRTLGLLLGLAGMIALIGRKMAGIDLSATVRVPLGLTVPVAAANVNVIRTAFWPGGTSALFSALNYTFQKVAWPVVFSQFGHWGTGIGVILAALLFGDMLGAVPLAGVAAMVVGGVLANRQGCESHPGQHRPHRAPRGQPDDRGEPDGGDVAHVALRGDRDDEGSDDGHRQAVEEWRNLR
jgi:drug/metabolite transporter (DMT)-like permease